MSPSEKIKYISEIQEGPNGPLFVVYPEAYPKLVFQGTSASGAWKKVLLKINDLREEAGISRTVASVSGRFCGGEVRNRSRNVRINQSKCCGCDRAAPRRGEL